MKVAIIADQHGSLPPVPRCDLMIVSGDITGGNPHGPRDNSDAQWRNWLATSCMPWTRQAPFTIMVGGNHDTCLEPDVRISHPTLIHLKDSGCEFGHLKFWGAPWIRKWDTLAFNLTDDEMSDKFALVPRDTDVVVCHMPPYGIGDMPGATDTHHVGSIAIKVMMTRVKPRLLTCGHIHDARGIYVTRDTTVMNAAGGFVEVNL